MDSSIAHAAEHWTTLNDPQEELSNSVENRGFSFGVLVPLFATMILKDKITKHVDQVVAVLREYTQPKMEVQRPIEQSHFCVRQCQQACLAFGTTMEEQYHKPGL